jgi:hypothetical protein
MQDLGNLQVIDRAFPADLDTLYTKQEFAVLEMLGCD